MKLKTFFSIMLCTCVLCANAQNSSRASDPKSSLGCALKTTGTISMSVGVPVLAAGLASILYAELLPNPVSGYTTSTIEANNADLTYMPTKEYLQKMGEYNGRVHAAQNAAYIMLPLGGALTIVGIPLYCYGKHFCDIRLAYMGNGVGLSMNF